MERSFRGLYGFGLGFGLVLGFGLPLRMETGVPGADCNDSARDRMGVGPGLVKLKEEVLGGTMGASTSIACECGETGEFCSEPLSRYEV